MIDTNEGSGSENNEKISLSSTNIFVDTINLFDGRIDDCSKNKWIPFYDLHLDPWRFSDSVSIYMQLEIRIYFSIEPWRHKAFLKTQATKNDKKHYTCTNI